MKLFKNTYRVTYIAGATDNFRTITFDRENRKSRYIDAKNRLDAIRRLYALEPAIKLVILNIEEVIPE